MALPPSHTCSLSSWHRTALRQHRDTCSHQLACSWHTHFTVSHPPWAVAACMKVATWLGWCRGARGSIESSCLHTITRWPTLRPAWMTHSWRRARESRQEAPLCCYDHRRWANVGATETSLTWTALRATVLSQECPEAGPTQEAREQARDLACGDF